MCAKYTEHQIGQTRRFHTLNNQNTNVQNKERILKAARVKKFKSQITTDPLEQHLSFQWRTEARGAQTDVL